MLPSPSPVAARGARATPRARLARGDGRASSTPRPQPVRRAVRRMRGRHPPTRWRVSSASDDAASLVPPPELDALADASSVETVDPTVAHVDEAARVWYVPSFLDADAEAAVAKCCQRLRDTKKMKPDKSFARGRRARAVVPVVDDAYAALSGARVRERLRAVTGCDLRCGDFPVEARLYLPGAEMAWHRDVRLYATPQFELILTVSNTSDARPRSGWDRTARRVRSAPRPTPRCSSSRTARGTGWCPRVRASASSSRRCIARTRAWRRRPRSASASRKRRG